ncbi:MAG: DUF1674 domain-containing protein [Woeseia sp.]
MADDNARSLRDIAGGAAQDTNDNAQAYRKGEKPEREIGGRDGPDPSRYGDWEKDGRRPRCSRPVARGLGPATEKPAVRCDDGLGRRTAEQHTAGCGCRDAGGLSA